MKSKIEIQKLAQQIAEIEKKLEIKHDSNLLLSIETLAQDLTLGDLLELDEEIQKIL